MRHGGATARLVAGLALALALTAAVAPFAGIRALAQENGQASITIYTAICPAGFTGDDYFGECYDNPGEDITYELTAPGASTPVTATTGANGFVAFEGLTVEGQYVLQNTLPGDFVDLVVRCSEDGADFPIAPGAHFGQYLLNLTTDNDIRCDFYVIGEDQGAPEILTVYKATCPAGYDDGEFFRDCFENATANVTFFVTPLGGGTTVQDTTDASGFASFQLEAGGWVVEEDVPGDFADFFAYCTAANGDVIDVGYSADGSRLVFDLPNGQNVRCDWYNIPVDQGGETPAPTQAPKPTSTVSALPNTGAGAGDGSAGSAWTLAGALALVVVAAGGLAATRLRPARAGARGR